MIIPTIIFTATILCLDLFSFSSSQPLGMDFCVADPSLPYGPAGFSCKNPLTVIAGDFYGTGVLKAPNTANIFKTGQSPAFVQQIPGLNGLGVSMARVDIQPGGVVPLHTHPDATEVLTVLQGNMTAGFISTNNTVYLKSLVAGDVFVFPQGLLHFQVNAGINPSVAIAAYSSSNPNIQIVDFALFSSALPSELIAKTSFISIMEVRRLKALFGGSG